MSLIVLFNSGGAAPTAYVLDTTVGSFSVSGQTATLVFDRKLQTTESSYSVIGQTATTEFDRKLETVAGSCLVLAQNAELVYTLATTGYSYYDGSVWVPLAKKPRYWTGSSWMEITKSPVGY